MSLGKKSCLNLIKKNPIVLSSCAGRSQNMDGQSPHNTILGFVLIFPDRFEFSRAFYSNFGKNQLTVIIS